MSTTGLGEYSDLDLVCELDARNSKYLHNIMMCAYTKGLLKSDFNEENIKKILNMSPTALSSYNCDLGMLVDWE